MVSLQEVSDFFTRYNVAFDALDGDAVARLWHDASDICAAGDVIWWPERESMHRNMRALCDAYKQAGYVRARHRIISHVPMGADAAFVNVAWMIEGQHGRVLQSFNTGYNLQRFTKETPASVRVVMCTAYEENLNEIRANAAH